MTIKKCLKCDREVYAKGKCKFHYWADYNKKRTSLNKLSDASQNARSRPKGTYTIPKRKKLSDADIRRREIMKGFVSDYTSQVQMFRDIADEALNKGRVYCFVSGREITNILKGERWMSCMAHVLRKSSFPKWKLKRENIRLLHPDVHFLVDNWIEEYRKKYSYNFDKWFELQYKFKKQYYES